MRPAAWAAGAPAEAGSPSLLADLLEGAKIGLICSTLVPLRLATLLAIFTGLSGARTQRWFTPGHAPDIVSAARCLCGQHIRLD